MPKKKKGNKKENVGRRRKRLRIGRIAIVFLVFFALLYILTKIISFPIKNIYVEGNNMFTDQEIIEMAKLSDYPSIFEYTSHKIEKMLEANTYIQKATIKKKKFKEVYIKIVENKPLFYNKSKEKTVLSDKTEIDSILDVPLLINYVPDTIYDKMIDKILLIDDKIYSKVSEIKYAPNKVDDKRFLFTMNDGNYVYLTLNHFEKINNYVEIMQEVLSKYKEDRGILYLDEGEYFQRFD